MLYGSRSMLVYRFQIVCTCLGCGFFWVRFFSIVLFVRYAIWRLVSLNNLVILVASFPIYVKVHHLLAGGWWGGSRGGVGMVSCLGWWLCV